MMRCDTCRFWDNTLDDEPVSCFWEMPTDHGTCTKAVFFEDIKRETWPKTDPRYDEEFYKPVDGSSYPAVVWDGSGFKGSLTTHKDHYCACYQAALKEDLSDKPWMEDVRERQKTEQIIEEFEEETRRQREKMNEESAKDRDRIMQMMLDNDQ